MVAIIDYRMGNLRSVAKALEKAGAQVSITTKLKDIIKAEALVLPGVGAFGQGIKYLRELGIVPVLKEEIHKGKPFLGICLGMQLLFSYSEEQGKHKGLNVIKGKVKRFPENLKVPHMGWNQIKIKHQRTKSRIFRMIPDNAYFYFVHSYYVIPEDENVILATTDYGIEFPAIIQKDNVLGVQFHPEKSQNLGIRILKNFISMI